MYANDITNTSSSDLSMSSSPAVSSSDGANHAVYSRRVHRSRNVVTKDTHLLSLYQTFRKSFDVIVIGAGISGLTYGALTAYAGKKRVLVLEREDCIGGSSRTLCLDFPRQTLYDTFGFRESINDFEDAVDLIDPTILQIDNGPDKFNLKHIVFDRLDITDVVSDYFISSRTTFKVVIDNECYHIPSGINEARSYLISKFPKEQSAILQYFLDIEEIASATVKFIACSPTSDFILYPLRTTKFLIRMKYQKQTLKDYLDTNFHDEKLKLILTANSCSYTNDPSDISFASHCLVQRSLLDKFAMVSGGVSSICHLFKEIIEANSGAVLTNCLVTGVTTRDAALSPLQRMRHFFARASLPKRLITNVIFTERAIEKEIMVPCSVVVCATNPKVFCASVFHDQLQTVPVLSTRSSKSSFRIYFTSNRSLSSVYKGMKYLTALSSLHMNADVQNAMKELSSQFEALLKELNIFDHFGNLASEILAKQIVVINTSSLKLHVCSKHRSVCTIVIPDKYSKWHKLSVEQAKAAKEFMFRLVLIILEHHFPKLSSLIDFYFSVSPCDIEKIYSRPLGRLFGYEQKIFGERCKIAVNDPIVSNLLFAGTNCFPGETFSGRMASAYLAFRHTISHTYRLQHMIYSCLVYIASFSVLVGILVLSLTLRSILSKK